MTTPSGFLLAPARTALIVAAALLAGAPAPARAQAGDLNIYSSRHYDADKEIVGRFTRATGIRVNVVEGEIGPLLQRLGSEGRNSPADLLITVDAGNLWRAQEAGLFQPIRSVVLEETIPADLRDPAGHWFALSQRARVIMFARDRVRPEELSTYEALADAKWKARIVVRSSSHIYNQSLVASLIAAAGVEKTELWARGLVANFARPPRGGDTDQILALGDGEADIAIANTYYLGRMLASTRPEDRAIAAKIGVFFPNQGAPGRKGRGAHVNISGAGITRFAPHREQAIRFLEFLVSPEIQVLFAEGNFEYPVRPGIATSAVIDLWGAFQADTAAIASLGRNNAEAVRIADRAGWR